MSYLSRMASLNSERVRLNPCSLRGLAANQLDAPGSASWFIVRASSGVCLSTILFFQYQSYCMIPCTLPHHFLLSEHNSFNNSFIRGVDDVMI